MTTQHVNGTRIGQLIISRQEYYQLKAAGAVTVGEHVSSTPARAGEVISYAFFREDGMEVAHVSFDLYEIAGVAMLTRHCGDHIKRDLRMFPFPDQNTPEARYRRYRAAYEAYGWTGAMSEEQWMKQKAHTDSYSY